MTTPDTPFRADDDAAAELRRLVDDYRSRCLWKSPSREGVAHPPGRG